MAFIKDLYRDEIRNGYLVTSDIKKVWNRQLEIWQEVDRICRKHAINYWAAYGTLLGAVRHKGYIPWDEDFDLCMMRPDFNRFREVVNDELKGIFEIGQITLGLFKIAHSQTTLIDYIVRKTKPQGLEIDIFVLDIADDSSPEGSLAYKAFRELLFATGNYEKLLQAVRAGKMNLLNDLDALKEIFELPDEMSKIKMLAVYLDGLFNQSSKVAWIQDSINEKANPFDKEWFRETVYLPFETIELPVPVDCDKILTSFYGDWRTPVNDGNIRLGNFHSADIPWREFLQRVDFELMLPKK